MEFLEKEFDFAVGGEGYVPAVFNLDKYADARSKEILALNRALEGAQKGGLIFQRLPRSMRRRVMAHDSKRMPNRLKEAHAKQLERNGALPSNKRPSRKFRRRPLRLLEEYNRRQKKFIWLETHIWHAKRFRMIEKWGYKLPFESYARTYRSCFRASATHCLLQDISYYICLEISGPESKIIEGLNVHVSDKCGLTFASKAFLSGRREGSVTFFAKNSFPLGAIGPIKFLWKCEEENERNRAIWLWIHPALYAEVLEALVETFCLVKETVVASDFPETGEMKKLQTHNVFESPETYVSVCKQIIVTFLKDKLNRFRLTGPLSNAVLVDSLSVPFVSEKCSKLPSEAQMDIEVLRSDDEEEEKDSKISNGDCVNTNPSTSSQCRSQWWESYYVSSEKNYEVLEEQRNFMLSVKDLSSPAQLPSHQVVGLTILDPRYQLPSKRIKSVPKVSDAVAIPSSAPPDISLSPIWNSNLRLQCSSSKLTSKELFKLRKERYFVPGFHKHEMDAALTMNIDKSCSLVPSYLPILLIQRPGSQDPILKRLGFGSGWDIIMPAGWAMPMWMALIFRGARPGGLKQTISMGLESGSMEHLDIYAPDTSAGRVEEACRRELRRSTHFRKTPKNRPNFIKLGVASPFECCWSILVKDWCQNKQVPDDSFYVLRDRVKLDALKRVINSRKSNNNNNGNGIWSDQISQISGMFSNMNHNFLIPVRIEPVEKGVPSDCAMICIPCAKDLKDMKNTDCEDPCEPSHKDENILKRKELKSQHKKELKRLRKHRKSNYKKLQEQMDLLLEKGESIKHLVNIKKNKMPTKEINEKYNAEMSLLWVPEIKTVKDSCSRTVVGFVCKGDFSFSESQGVGIGYIPFPAFINLVNSWITKPIVLFRNPSSLQYRYAILKIC